MSSTKITFGIALLSIERRLWLENWFKPGMSLACRSTGSCEYCGSPAAPQPIYQPPPPPPPPPPPENPPPPLPEDEPGGVTDELIALPRPLVSADVLRLKLPTFQAPLYQLG